MGKGVAAYRDERSEIVRRTTKDNLIISKHGSLLLRKSSARSLLCSLEQKGTPAARMGQRVSMDIKQRHEACT